MNDSLLTFKTSQGLELRGTLLRLARHQVVFEIYNPATVLRVSEVLDGFKIFVSGQLIYSGKAVTTNLINSGVAVVCEAHLDDVWVNLDQVYSGLSAEGLKQEFKGFFGGWQKQFHLSREYRLFVSELYSYFHDLRLWLEHVELGIRSRPTADRQVFEHDLVQQLGQDAISVFQFFVERFEALAAGLEPETVPAHQAYMRRQMHPLLLCSPFVYRTFAKPLGYAGDYEMVNMLFRDPFEGATLFAKVVNFCFLNQGSTFAHRNRVDYLTEKLILESLRLAQGGRGLRALSVGCGPAVEVQRFLGQGRLAARGNFELLDFNDETLQHTRQAVTAAGRQHGVAPSVRLTRKSVHQIVKEAARSTQAQSTAAYDYVYCAGLFDYLTDQVCRRLIEVMFHWLAPGGLLVVTNVTPANPIRYGMEHVLDWTLVYRNAPQMALLKPARIAAEATVASDATGVNLWMEMRKPKHG
jgi:extracellular factor (EF) 3-hydroxypalmitic acid methyl ester biosynthesis protein